MPSGFNIQRFAEGLDNPRLIAVADDGTIYVTERGPGALVMLRDLDGDGIADVQKTVLQIEQLHGIALRDGKIYLIDTRKLYVADVQPDGSIGTPQMVIDDLPDAGQHADRSLAFGPDGMLYVSVGSTCNACQETNRENATLLRVDPSNWKREIFASGLRNTIGFDWHPGSKRLYGLEHGIDDLGDDTPGEELNELIQGAMYGWPFVYENNRFMTHPLPSTMTQEEWARKSTKPVALYRAHSAPMQFFFYTGAMFPQEYRGDGFATMHGSWNRKSPSGYEVVRVRFDRDGKFSKFELFMTEFLQKQGGKYGYVGRPVGLATAKDGALLVGDDSNNVIYRVAYGPQQTKAVEQDLAGSLLRPKSFQKIDVRSAAIPAGGMIDEQYTDYGQRVSPPLSWSGVPSGTRSLVLMMEDPEAKSPVPFVHWIIANIRPRRMACRKAYRPTSEPSTGRRFKAATPRARPAISGRVLPPATRRIRIIFRCSPWIQSSTCHPVTTARP